MQDCGKCINFVKLKHMEDNGGICVWWDSRTDTDLGHKCKHFKKMKYERKKPKGMLNVERMARIHKASKSAESKDISPKPSKGKC